METILAGELGQMSKRYDLNVTIEDYLENISGKTAELFALSCFIGAYESGASLRLANQAKTIGQSIGLAFQIMDDILITAKAKVPWVSLSLKMSSRGLLTAVVVGTEKSGQC